MFLVDSPEQRRMGIRDSYDLALQDGTGHSQAGSGVHRDGAGSSAAHPYPVILTEGTVSSMDNSFGALSPDLANNGYCVHAFNHGQTLPLTGIYATGDIAASASQLAAEVTHVLAETGAADVNMLVGLAPSTYGTTLDGLVTLISDFGTLGIATALLSVTCPACTEQIQGSSLLASLNATPTAPGVH